MFLVLAAGQLGQISLDVRSVGAQKHFGSTHDVASFLLESYGSLLRRLFF